MRPIKILFCHLLLAAVCFSQGSQQRQDTGVAVLFEGARLIVGDGRAPIENSAFVVGNGRFLRVGRKGQLRAPDGAVRVDVTGKTVMPALVNLHGHLGYASDLSFAAENYTRETLIDHLNRYAYYGVGAVLTLGTDAGDLASLLREEQRAGTIGGALVRTAGRGLAALEAGPAFAPMKPAAYGVVSEEEARKAVRDLAAAKVDVVKIWVDDRNGTVQKLQPNLYGTIIDEAHKHNLRVIAHVFYLSDAKNLVRAGIDGFAHLVRDQEIDDELIALIRRRNVFIMPNLGGSERASYAESPPWLEDPALGETVSRQVIRRLAGSFASRDAGTVARARNTYRNMQRSLARLVAAGARIALGTDSGIPDQFFGYTEQRELELMGAGGMTPAQVIVAATRTPAEILGLEQLGTVAEGKSADFIVLDANPLDNIANTRRIARVYIRGKEVDRAALRAGWNRTPGN
jgi:imidazolonepropionase-like amidohydrolase